jgi:hypothetical protein
MQQLNTWGHKTIFSYEGNVSTGTTITYGRGAGSASSTPFTVLVTAAQYTALLAHFKGSLVAVGSSREPKSGSLEHWLQDHVTPTAVASYVAPILVHERKAVRVAGDDALIQFP